MIDDRELAAGGDVVGDARHAGGVKLRGFIVLFIGEGSLAALEVMAAQCGAVEGPAVRENEIEVAGVGEVVLHAHEAIHAGREAEPAAHGEEGEHGGDAPPENDEARDATRGGHAHPEFSPVGA